MLAQVLSHDEMKYLRSSLGEMPGREMRREPGRLGGRRVVDFSAVLRKSSKAHGSPGASRGALSPGDGPAPSVVNWEILHSEDYIK